MSLLKSELSQEKHLLFPNLEDPLGDLPPQIDALADIDTGAAFRKGFNRIKTQYPMAIPVGIVIYMDKLALDRHGHLSLEPVYFTLTIFNRLARNQPNAWRPAGYMPNLQLQSRVETAKCLKGHEKVQLYHSILTLILQQMQPLLDVRVPDFKFDYRGKEYTANLKLFYLVVLGDTEAHDKLVARKGDRSETAKRICRCCDAPTSLLDDPEAQWDYTLQSMMQDLVDAGDIKGLDAITYHFVQTCWKQLGIDFGGMFRGLDGKHPN
jgi:hypothetical protein